MASLVEAMTPTQGTHNTRRNRYDGILYNMRRNNRSMFYLLQGMQAKQKASHTPHNNTRNNKMTNQMSFRNKLRKKSRLKHAKKWKKIERADVFYNHLKRVKSGHGSGRQFEGFYSRISKTNPEHTLILSIQASELHHCYPRETFTHALFFDGEPRYQEWEVAVSYKGPSIIGRGMVFVNPFHESIDLENCCMTGDNVWGFLSTETVQRLYQKFISISMDDLRYLLETDGFWGPHGKETLNHRTEKNPSYQAFIKSLDMNQ